MKQKVLSMLTVGLCLLLLTLTSSSLATDATANRSLNLDDLNRGESQVGTASIKPKGSIITSSQPRFLFQGVDYWEHLPFDDPDSDLSLSIVRSMGANWIAVWAYACQDGPDATMVYTCPYMASDAELSHLIAQAHSLGLNVMFKLSTALRKCVPSFD